MVSRTVSKSRVAAIDRSLGRQPQVVIHGKHTNEPRSGDIALVWLEQLTSLTVDLTTNKLLTKNLGITPSDDPEADTQLIFNRLSNLGGKSLLVIDNADDQLQSFKDYLPQAPDWHVLITSRQELSFAKILALEFLSADDALKLFYQHYTRDRDDKTVKEIIKTVDYHTLTVELLAKTAQKRRIDPIRNLAELLEERGLQIGRRIDFSVDHSREDQVKKLFPYLKAIFQLDENFSEEEIWLLKQFIGLPPTFVAFDDLTGLLQIDREDEEAMDSFTHALDQLKEKGWLTHDDQQEAYKMHRIIQEVLQEYLEPKYDDLKTLVEVVSSSLYVDQEKDNPIDKFPFVPFGERILGLFPSGEEETFTRFQSNLATVYQALGRYESAVDLWKQAYQIFYSLLGEEHPNTKVVKQFLDKYDN